MENSTELEKHIDSLRNYVARTDHKYAINYQKGRDIHPIPFFGNIKTDNILDSIDELNEICNNNDYEYKKDTLYT